MVLDKSFHNYDDSFTAFNEHVLFQKQQELLYRVDQFAFNDWTDVQLDSDVVMGRLLHNRIGYTTKRNIAMLLGLKPEPWIGPMEEEILTKIPPGENVTRQEIWKAIPREMNIERFNATSRMPLQILGDKCWSSSSSRKFRRRRRLSLFHRVQDVYDPLSFEDALEEVVRRMGPVKASTLRFYVSRSFEELTVALMNLEQSGRIAKVMALVPEPEAFFCAPDEVELNRPRREDRTVRILTQSDPYVSRFIWEVRSVLDRGWYLPIFKELIHWEGFDVQSERLPEIKDLHVPTAYLDEFVLRSSCFSTIMLPNWLTFRFFQTLTASQSPRWTTPLGRHWKHLIQGDRGADDSRAIVDPQPRKIAERALFHKHHLHQSTSRARKFSAEKGG